MRFDIVSIFPQFFSVLDLSLLGKAKEKQALDWQVHDLRDWTADRHRSVDDTPYGGGAGMVMRPDIWGKAIEDILASYRAKRPVLAVPSPSGIPLTQQHLSRLASENDQIIFACGRYEGIDSRVVKHYQSRTDLEVFEFSLGDYVLNGGEVAALAVIEGVGRLVEGVVGNPDSLVEESHTSDPLLEYPVYTKPPSWKDHQIPPVLLSGNHRQIGRWRRNQALAKTALRRPDLLTKLDRDALDFRDREVLAASGYVLRPDLGRVRFRLGDDPQTISRLAGRLFPLACPDGLPSAAIESFIASELSAQRFEEYLKCPTSFVLLAEVSPLSASFSPSGFSLEGEWGQNSDQQLVDAQLTERKHPGPDTIAGGQTGPKGALVKAGGMPPAPWYLCWQGLGAAKLAVGQEQRAGVAPRKWYPVGYTLVETAPAAGLADFKALVPPGLKAAYVSKCYLDATWHGSGIAGALLEATHRFLRTHFSSIQAAVLGTNSGNRGAKKFYRRHDYRFKGRRIFDVGGVKNFDVLAVRDFTSTKIPSWAPDVTE